MLNLLNDVERSSVAEYISERSESSVHNRPRLSGISFLIKLKFDGKIKEMMFIGRDSTKQKSSYL